MIYLKVYQKYIVNNFLATLTKIFLIFFSLAFILTIFEEISFFKDTEISFFIPFFLTFLSVPSILYEIFPFIFLISTQFFFIKLGERHELIALKNFGLDKSGYRIITNDGKNANQEVAHFHIHILGGENLGGLR